MKHLKRLLCLILGHEPELLYETYIRKGRRFIKCCPVYKCKRCDLKYYGYGLINPQLLEILEATLKDFPELKFGHIFKQPYCPPLHKLYGIKLKDKK